MKAGFTARVMTVLSLGLLTMAPATFASEVVMEDLTSADALEEALVLEMGGEEAMVDNHFHPYPPRPVRYMCYARNARGMVFQGRGRRPQRAQQKAMDNCYQAGSRFCFAAGCQPIGF